MSSSGHNPISILFISKLEDCCKEGDRLTFGGENANGYAISMNADGLTRKNPPKGSTPDVKNQPNTFKEIKRRKKGDGPYYVLGHLLNHNLGGTGKEMKNLTPLTGAANSNHLHVVEENVKKAVDDGNTLEYHVKPEYGRSAMAPLTAAEAKKVKNPADVDKIRAEEKNVAVALNCEAYLVNPKDKTKVKVLTRRIPNEIDQRPESYDFDGRALDDVYLDCGNATKIKGIDPDMKQEWADKVVTIMKDRKSSGKRIDTYDTVVTYEIGGKPVFNKTEQKRLKALFSLSHVKLYEVK